MSMNVDDVNNVGYLSMDKRLTHLKYDFVA